MVTLIHSLSCQKIFSWHLVQCFYNYIDQHVSNRINDSGWLNAAEEKKQLKKNAIAQEDENAKAHQQHKKPTPTSNQNKQKALAWNARKAPSKNWDALRGQV